MTSRGIFAVTNTLRKVNTRPVKILVLDDNEPIRVTLGMVLECYGYTPLLAETPAMAYQFLETEEPKALILDLTLGEESGEAVYQEIQRRFGSAPPTLVLSAVLNGHERVRRLQGADFLAKPYTLEELAARLATILERSPAA